MDIRKNALLVRLNISAWGEERRTHEVEEAGAEKYKAAKRRIKATKSLVDSSTLRMIQKAQREMRDIHYRMTLPWTDKNERLITCQGYPAYLDAIRKKGQEIQNLVQQLGDEWPSLKEQSKEELQGLGELWRDGDYPEAEELKESFSHRVTFNPVPSAGDVRVEGLGEEEVQKIKQEIEEESNKKATEAQQAVWDELVKKLGHLQKKLDDRSDSTRTTKSRLHETTLENLVDLARLIPSLNLTQDANLDHASEMILETFDGLEIDNLKETPEVYQGIVKEMLSDVENLRKEKVGLDD